MFARLFASAYYRIRGHRFAAEEIPSAVLAAFTFRKAFDLVRGIAYRPFYGSARGMHFRGPRVTVRHPRYVHLGSHVAFGAGVSMDAFSTTGIRLGSRVTVGDEANLVATAVIREQGVGVEVGDDTSIGRSNIIWGQGGVKIGANCLLGPDVSIFSENHVYADPRVPIRLQGNHRAGVTIEDDCWIGAGSTILAGVVIGCGSVIAAGSVVTKAVDANTVVAGVPARIIGQRSLKTDSLGI